MAFETGTAATLTELFDVRLKSFMAAQGWVVNEDNFPTFLALSKGDCYINIRWDQSTTNQVGNVQSAGTNSFNDAFGVPRIDRTVWFHLSSGYTSGGAGWGGQPNSLVTSTSINGMFAMMNDLEGPFTSYAFFSGNESAGDPSYVYMVLETRPGLYHQLFFGNGDIQGLGYAPGCAFLATGFFKWWPDSTLDNQREDINSAAGDHAFPFGYTPSNSRTFNQTQVYAGGALPGALVRGGTFSSGLRSPVVPIINTQATGVSQATSMWARLPFMPNNAVSGVFNLMPIPLMVVTSELNDPQHYLGQVPNLRMISMVGLRPGQEIQYGEDSWLVYPFRAQQITQTAPVVNPSPALTNSSFQLGFAIRRRT